MGLSQIKPSGLPVFESIVSTMDPAGIFNFAPMGVQMEGDRIFLRPYRNTTTFRNLVATGCGVANFTDNVLLFVQTALSKTTPSSVPARQIRGARLEDVCHYLEFVVTNIVDNERAEVFGRVVGQEQIKNFSGFCRGKHAVIEGTILATRLHLIPRDHVFTELARCQQLVDKTGGAQEKEVMTLLIEFIRQFPNP